MIGCVYDHGQWVALHLESHPQTGDTLVLARVGDCPGDADGRDVPLARRPSAGAALYRALRRLTAGWRHACDELPAPAANARGDRMPGPAAGRCASRPDRHAGAGTRCRRLRGGRRPARVLLLRNR